MKHIKGFLALSAVMMLSSCITITKTARTAETSSSIQNATVADLKVSDHRVTYTMTPSKEIQRAGLSNVKQAAIQEALTQNGNADIMVEPEFVISLKNKFIFGKEVSSITVSGRPAYYQNFRTLPDSVWSTPGFYGQSKLVAVGKTAANNGGKRGGIAGLLGKLGGKDRKEVEDTGWRRSGLKLHVNIMGGYSRTHYKNTSNNETENSDGSGFLGALGAIGIQTGSHLFVGVGSGFYNDWEHSSQFVPLYGDVRYYLSSQKSSAFLDFKVGGGIQVGDWDVKGGVFLAPSLGYSFGSFELGVQFMYQAWSPCCSFDLDK